MRIPALLRRVVRIAVLPAVALTAGVLIGGVATPTPFPVSVTVSIPAPVTSDTVAALWIEPMDPVPASMVCTGDDLPVTLYSRTAGVTAQQRLCLPVSLTAASMADQVAYALSR